MTVEEVDVVDCVAGVGEVVLVVVGEVGGIVTGASVVVTGDDV